MESPATSSASAATRPGVVWLAVAVVYLALAIGSVRFGGMNPDEGFYAAAARAAWQGEMPYRDFGYTQMPLLPYINGVALAWSDFGLFAQRAVNGIWSALTVGLLGCWLTRRHGARPAMVAVLLLAANPAWMYFNHLGKTYAFTGLVALTAAIVHLELKPSWRKCALLGSLGIVGLGCRLPAAPFFALLWLAALVESWPRTRGAWPLAGAIVGPLLTAVVLLGPFGLAAAAEFRFWTFDFHRSSLPSKDWQVGWVDHLALAPGAWVAAGFACAVWIGRPRWSPAIALGGAALVTLAANLLPRGTYEEYATPLLPALVLAAAVGLSRLTGRTATAGGALLLAAQLLLPPALGWRAHPERRFTPAAWLTANAPPYEPALPAQLERVRAAVNHYAGPTGHVVGPNLIVALSSGRPIAPDLRMGPFTATSELSAAAAARLHLATPERLLAEFSDPRCRLLAFFTRPLLNYAWSMPSFANLPQADRRAWVELFRRDFEVVLQEGDFLLLARRPLTAPPAPPP